MDKVEKIYQLYLDKGLISNKTTLDMFRSSTDDQLNKVYDLGLNNGLFKNTDIDTFKSAWTSPEPLKKKDETLEPTGTGSEVSGQPATGTPALESDLTSQPSEPFISRLPSAGSMSNLPSELKDKVKESIPESDFKTPEGSTQLPAKGKSDPNAPKQPLDKSQYYLDQGESKEYSIGEVLSANKLGITVDEYRAKTGITQQDLPSVSDREKFLEDQKKFRENYIKQSYIDEIANNTGMSEEEIKQNLPKLALNNLIFDPEGEGIKTDPVQSLKDIDRDEILAYRQKLADQYLNDKAKDLGKKAFDIMLENRNGDVELTQETFAQGMDDLGLMFLSNSQKQVKDLKESIYRLESFENLPEDKKILLEKGKAELKRFVDEGIVGSGELFDPKTGQFVSGNTKDQEIIAFNKKVDEKAAKYDKSDLGELKKERDNAYFKFESFVDEALDNSLELPGLVGAQREIWAKRFGLTTPTDEQGINARFTKEQAMQIIKSQADNPFNFGGFDLANSSISEAMAIMNSEVLGSDVTRKAEDLLGEYMAINKIISLNEDPGSREKYNDMSALNEYTMGIAGLMNDGVGEGLVRGLKEGFGGKSMSNLDQSRSAINTIQSMGYDITDEQKEVLETTMKENVAFGVGYAIPIMAELGATSMVTGGASNILKIPQAIKKISGGSKALEKALKFGYGMQMQGLNYELAGQGYIGGVGEFLGESAGESLVKMLGSNNKLLQTLSKVFIGAAGETMAEYSGELAQRLSDDGGSFYDNLQKTIGTPETAGEKLAETYLVSLMMAGTMGATGINAEFRRDVENTRLELEREAENSEYIKKVLKESKGLESGIKLVAEAESRFKKKNNLDPDVEVSEKDLMGEISSIMSEGQSKINEVIISNIKDVSNGNKTVDESFSDIVEDTGAGYLIEKEFGKLETEGDKKAAMLLMAYNSDSEVKNTPEFTQWFSETEKELSSIENKSEIIEAALEAQSNEFINKQKQTDDVQEQQAEDVEVGSGQEEMQEPDVEQRQETEVRQDQVTEGLTESVVDPEVSVGNQVTSESILIDPSKENIDITSKIDGVEVTEEVKSEASQFLSDLGLTTKKKKVVDQAINAAKAIQKVSPETKIIVHKTSNDYVSSGDNRSQNEGGEYDINTNTIHINLDGANDRTVAHEVFHAVLLSKGMSDKQAQGITTKMLESVRKTASPELISEIEDFASRYDTPLQSEESIAELFGILATEYEQLPRPTQNIIKRWLDKLAKLFGLKLFTDNDVIDMLNTVSRKVKEGSVVEDVDVKTISDIERDPSIQRDIRAEFLGGIPVDELTDSDIDQDITKQWSKEDVTESGPQELDTDQEQGSSGQVGTFTFKDKDSRKQKPPIPSSSNRSFESLIQEADLSDFNGQKFVTNMYDFTTAGEVELFEGGKINLHGGKSYVPFMMEKQGLKLGDKSNLAAFNSKANAEGFIRNAVNSGATLFAPHVGTKEGSWQFQQNIFDQLVNVSLKSGVLSNKQIIKLFNSGITSSNGKKAFNTFKKNLGKNIKNFNSFVSDPTEIVRLLDIENNYSPDLRKILNDKMSSSKELQAAMGVKNKIDFASKIEDPLNIGSNGGDIIGLVEFDNTDFDISKPKKDDPDYHPSFGWTVKAKINGIYQPSQFMKSSEVTDSYTKYNISGSSISKKSEIDPKKFEQSNVSSSAGAIPKVAKFDRTRKQRNENFERWKGDNKEYSGSEIQDVKTGEPVLLEVYHGTTNDFYEFDASVKGSIEGHLGKVNYFTSSESDAYQNYQGDGPDLTGRIEQRSERLEDDIRDDYAVEDTFDYKKISEDFNIDIRYVKDLDTAKDISDAIAKKELDGGEEKVMDLYVKLNNPVVLGKNSSWVDVIPEEMYEEYLDDATEEIADENGVSIDEAKEDYSYEIKDRAIEYSGIENPFIEALQDAINNNTYSGDVDGRMAGEILSELVYESEIDLSRLEKDIRKEIPYAENEAGELSSSQIIADFFKNLGYDGIILTDVSDRFPGMGLSNDTSHVHVFDENSNQIKLADGTNTTFDSKSRDIRKQLPSSKGSDSSIPKIDEIRKKAKKMGVSDQALNVALLELGYTQKQINSTKEKSISDAKKSYQKSINRGNSKPEALKSAIADLEKTYWYSDVSDTQRESAIRELRNELGQKEKKAPSVKKVLGKGSDKKVTVNEKTALKNQIRMEARAAKDSKRDQDAKRRAISEIISDIISESDKDSSVKTRKLNAIQKKINRTNLNNPVMVERLVNYIEKVISDADHITKMAKVDKVRSRIKKMSKKKGLDANLSASAKSFSMIDPNLVENIDEYIEKANEVYNGLKSTSITPSKKSVATRFNTSEINEYTEKALSKQDELIKESVEKHFEDLTGISGSEMTMKDMLKAIERAKESGADPSKLEAIEKSNIKEVYDVYSSIVSSMAETNTDPFTGESLGLDKNEIEIAKRLANLDVLNLTKAESIKAIDALSNFVTNQSLAGVEAIVSKAEGRNNAKTLKSKGVKSRPLKLYFSKRIGRLFAEQFTSLPIAMERMFGRSNARKFAKASGLTGVINGNAKANKQASNIISKYLDKFSKTRPNGEVFNSRANINERGLLAFMSRTVEGESDTEFERRKGLIEQSIEALEKGTKDDKQKAEGYKEVYNKLLKGSSSIDQVRSKADNKNVEAVDWWVDEWSKHYEDLQKTNLEVYNEILGEDVNYTPDVFKRVDVDEEIELDQSSFAGASGYLDKSKSGSLLKATRPSKLPKNAKGDATRYINLDFDANNSNMIQAALTDINTAKDIMKLEGFLNSPDFKDIVANKEDQDLIDGRIKDYVRNVKGSNYTDRSEMNNLSKAVEFVAALGVSKALGGVTQAVKQSVPVAMNTIVNSGRMDLSLISNPEVRSFIDNSGMPIANRGIASQASLDHIDRLLEEAASSTGKKLVKKLEDLNRFYLKMFLQNSDVFVARASFISYYKQALKRKGKEVGDWGAHEMDKDAADYAQQQVDRQQNVSDEYLQGKFFSSKEPIVKMVRKVAFPFANFAVNQKARMQSDVIALASKDTSKEDRIAAARSLGGLATEMAMFYSLSILLRSLIWEGAKSATDYDESDEEKEKRMYNQLKGSLTSIAKDIVSPSPVLDAPVMKGINSLLMAIQGSESKKEAFQLYEDYDRGVWDDWGVIGISMQKAEDMLDKSEVAITGEYEDRYGNKKEVTQEAQDDMKLSATLSILYNVGLLPSEFGSFADYIEKISKKRKKKKK